MAIAVDRAVVAAAATIRKLSVAVAQLPPDREISVELVVSIF
jgi:hypothetical protein